MSQIEIVGLPWYERKHWVRLQAMFPDGDKLHGTFDDWLAQAEQCRKCWELQGKRVIRVNIDPDRFAQWCRAKGFHMDAEARGKFASPDGGSAVWIRRSELSPLVFSRKNEPTPLRCCAPRLGRPWQ